MPAAPPYNRVYNFTNYQASNPATPLPAAQVDAELSQVKVTLDAMLQNVALIQRTDGALANGSVGQAQLSNALSIGFNFRGPWTTATQYNQGDGVFYNYIFYIAELSNFSGATTPNNDPTNWDVGADFTGSNLALAQAAATAAAASATQASGYVSTVAGSATAAQNSATAAQGYASNAAASATAAAASAVITPGQICFFVQNAAPTGWLWCNGSTISRTTYAALFTVSCEGTGAPVAPFGVGDGSTTFTLPDFRGAFLRCHDAGRGFDPGRTLGSFQDSKFYAHNHPVFDPGHSHTAYDVGHAHSYTESAAGVGGVGSSGDTVQIGATTGTGNANVVVNGASTGVSTANTGANETAPKNYSLLCCIKY